MTNNSQRSKISVLLCTYRGNEPDHLRTAISSVLEQTRPPDELLLVEDGPLTESLTAVLDDFRREYPDIISTVRLESNRGIGPAHQVGIENCSHDIVAIMDADDISLHDRFEHQIAVLEENPQIDLVGGYQTEFQTDPAETHTVRRVPTNPAEIVSLARYMMPVNHGTTMFRRAAALEAGNYRHAPGVEDYDLLIRMLMNGCTFTNVPRIVLKGRIDMNYRQRGGLKLAQEEIRLQFVLLRRGFISFSTFLRNLCMRVGFRLSPLWMRGKLLARFDPTRERM